MKHAEIALTGAGVVAPLGHDLEALAAGLLEGATALKPIEHFDTTPFPCGIGARVTDFRARDWVSNRKNLKLMSDAVRYGLAAVRRAALDAAVTAGEQVAPDRLGIFVGAGTAFGDTRDLLPALEKGVVNDGEGFDTVRFGHEGVPLINPLWLLKGLSNNVLGFASAALDAQGINQNYCHSGAGGLLAIGEAAWALDEGRADLIIAGGADNAVTPARLTGFGRLGLLLEADEAHHMRPFDRRAQGFCPGEGAGFVALERADHARARGAQILAYVRGFGQGQAAARLMSPDGAVVLRAAQRALEVAGWSPSDVDAVATHGNGNPRFDALEAEALATLFGDHSPPIIGDKSLQGHTVAAAGPLSLLGLLACSARGQLPAIAHLEDPIHGGLDFVSGTPRAAQPTRLLVHAAGLGGQTAWLAVERAQETA
ncbi:MAG: beta-ketoacyl-[acyl-carrier-protein] synthase family protein [Bradymonadia bacterium]